MSDPGGGPMAGVIIGSAELYEAAKRKVQEMGELLEKVNVAPHHLRFLDACLETLKEDMPVKSPDSGSRIPESEGTK